MPASLGPAIQSGIVHPCRDGEKEASAGFLAACCVVQAPGASDARPDLAQKLETTTTTRTRTRTPLSSLLLRLPSTMLLCSLAQVDAMVAPFAVLERVVAVTLSGRPGLDLDDHGLPLCSGKEYECLGESRPCKATYEFPVGCPSLATASLRRMIATGLRTIRRSCRKCPRATGEPLQQVLRKRELLLRFGSHSRLR